jgi:transcriptional antiterminator NusG
MSEEFADAQATDSAVDLVDSSVVEDVELDDAVEEENVSPELAAFRDELRRAPGDWFVVHSYAGYEKRVKGNLANRITS